tara:strand:+ start:669 stop:1250 length:582 start_codon:yes stop_codon:yes gene_type:complete
MDKINNFYDHELDCLISAIKDGKHDYHTFTISSLNTDFPEIRTVVLRGVKLDPLSIFFNSDNRSPKIEQLKNNPICSALFYDKVRRVQLRFKAKAKIHYQNKLSSKVWDMTPLQSRKCYMGPFPPSQALDQYHPNIPLEYLKTDPEKYHSEDGYVNFAHIELVVLEVDVLKLHHDGHVRFKVTNGSDYIYLSP